MDGKIKRKIDNGYVRLHEAVSDSVYMRGDGLESQTLTDFAKPHRVSFLHISDPHSQTWGMQVLRNILAGANTTYANANDVMGLVTGDLTRGGNINNYGSHTTNGDYPVEIMAKWNRGLSSVTYNNKPMLLVKGNHDTVDTNVSLDEAAANTAFVFEANQDASGDIVTYATVGNTKQGYWYKDFTHNGVTMRMIGLDEYQHSLIAEGETYPTTSPAKYAKLYSEEQLEWLVDLLKATPKEYYIVIVHHQPQYAMHPADVVNDFTHHGREGQQGTRYLNGMSAELEGNIDTIAQIVDAYLHKKTTEVTCLNAALASGNENREITIEPDFRDATPALFACHVCGHTHRDFHEYHPEYPEQLCLTIASNLIEASGGEEMFQDVVREGSGVNSYLMNRVTIDADRNVVVVERIGAGTLRDDVLIQDGSARKAIEFPIKPVAVEPTPADALATYCPIIEDTRENNTQTLTGNAPFATLNDGQRIILSDLKFTLVYSPTLNLTLSNGAQTGAIPMYCDYSGGSTLKTNWGGLVHVGASIALIFDATNSRWICLSPLDTNTTYATLTQSEIDAGTSTTAKVVFAKLLCDNFQKLTKHLTNFLPSGAVAPQGGYLPNILYDFGTTDSVTFGNLAAGASGVVNLYLCTWTCQTDGCSVTLPQSVVIAGGESMEIKAGRTFEITIRDNKLSYLYFD